MTDAAEQADQDWLKPPADMKVVAAYNAGYDAGVTEERKRIRAIVVDIPRYDAIEESDKPMRYQVNGDWILYDEVLAAIASQPEKENEE